MVKARASELPMLIVNGADSPRSRIGRGLESVGSMTAETLQRISTAVGGVVKSPVVLMAKVGGLASPQATNLTTPPRSSLEERLYHLEKQMKSLEEKFSPITVVPELDLSTHSHKEKPRIAKSLLQEMEADKILEKRVQMLEDHVTECMERFEKALSSIQSRLDHVQFIWQENVARNECQENLLGEPQYYDAEQQSDNFEVQEVAKQNLFGGSPTLEKSCVKEASCATPTIVKHVEPMQELDVAKDEFLEPQVVSTLVYSKEAFMTQQMKSIAPTSELAKFVYRNDDGNLATSSDQQLTSTLEELHGSFVTQSLAEVASAKFLEIAQAITAEKSILAHASTEPPITSKCMEELSMALLSANFEETEKEDSGDKNVTVIAIGESPEAFAIQNPQEDFVKESLVGAPCARPSHEPSSQEDLSTTGDMALASFESPMASKSAEELVAIALGTNFEELAQEDVVDKDGCMIVASKFPLASSLEECQEESIKEFMAGAPSVEFAQLLATQEDIDIQVASLESQTASKFVKEPLDVAPSVDFEEPTQEDVAYKIGTTMETTKLLLTSSSEEPNEGFENESMAFAPSGEPTQEHSDIETTSSEIEGAFIFVKEALAIAPNANFGIHEYKVDADERSTINANAEPPFSSSFDDPQEDFEKESSAIALLAIQKDNSMALAAPETTMKSKFVEDPLTTVASVKFKEHACEDVDKGVTMTTTIESPLPTSHQDPHDDFEKDSLAPAPSARPIHESSSQQDSSATSDKVLASFETQVASKFVEEPSLNILSTNFEELAQEGGVKNETMIVDVEPPLASSFEEQQEDFEKESFGASSSHELAQELALEKDSHMVPSTFESKETSKSLEEGSHAAKESEYKLAEDFKVHHEHIKSIENEFQRRQSNLAHVGSNKSLTVEDGDDCMGSDQSSEEFYDTEHGSSSFESWIFDEPNSFEEFSVGLNEPCKATKINVVAQKEIPVPTSSVEPIEESEQAPIQKLEQEHDQGLIQDHKSAKQAYVQVPRQDPEQKLEQQSMQEPAEELGYNLEQQSKQPLQELEQEDLTRSSAMVLSPLEPQVTSKSRESLELFVEEPLVAIPSSEFQKHAQANVDDKSGILDLPLTSTTKEPQIDTIVFLEKILSSASFHQSGNPKILENHEQNSSSILISSTPKEALEREPLTTASTTKIVHEHDVGKNNDVHISLEPQLEESKEALANEPMKVVPSFESIESAQEVDDGHSGAILASSEPQLTPTLGKPLEGFVKEPLVNAALASKSMDLEESLADEPLAKTSAKLAQESIVDKDSARLIEESPLTPIVEEPQDDNVSSLVEDKHGQDKANKKFLEDVKIIPMPIEEAIPRTQSDLTHVKLNPIDIAKDSITKLHSQGSFLAIGATSVDPKEALVKEPLPSTELLELLEEEPQKPLDAKPEPLLASTKSVPKDHASRKIGFARSSSEPQFAYNLEEHQKALAPVPSALELGEDHAQEDFDDTQCLPFKILGEGKHPQKESEFQLVEDVKSPTTKFETTSSSPYVLEPKPSKIKEKKKKEKKEKKSDVATKEKERRLSLGLEEMERKSSLRVEEKDSKYSPRANEKRKQPFKHLRDRLRHAFSVNKKP